MTDNAVVSAGNDDFQLFTLPGHSYVVAYGINDLGHVTGFNGFEGFIDDNGSITPVTVPYSYPVPLAINNLDQVVGEFPKSDGGHAFIDTNGTITYPSLPVTPVEGGAATGINDLGQVVGQFTGTTGTLPQTITTQFGFIDNNGTLTHLTLKDGSTFLPTGINDFDRIVGTTTAAVTGVLNLRTGAFEPIQVPGAASTDATAINNLGQVAGTYVDSAGRIHAFVDTYGRFEFLQLPASFSGTLEAVTAINDLGQIVGHFAGPNGTTESFIATPHDLPPLVQALSADLWQAVATHHTGGAWHTDINAGHAVVAGNVAHA